MEAIYDWFMALGEPYGVNPIIFGGIYVGAIPFFWLTMWWLVRNIRARKPVYLPIIAACCCAVSSYVYLIIVGQNVPSWVYILIVAIIVYAIYSTVATARKKARNLAVDDVENA